MTTLASGSGSALSVWYHGGCDDGFGAAWALWRKHFTRASYTPVAHGEPPPPLPQEATVVLILDFCYPPEGLLCLPAFTVHVEDHHETAEAAIAAEGSGFFRSVSPQTGGRSYWGGAHVTCHFDLLKSGARLAWEHAFPGTPTPPLIAYVEDRDLGRLALPDSAAVTAWIRSWPHDFRRWTELNDTLLHRPEEAVAEGRAVLRARTQLVARCCEGIEWVEIQGYTVPVANAPPTVATEVCQALLALFTDPPPFAATWYDDGAKEVWTLRSRPDFDVSAVAVAMGGGGHRQAAGFAYRDTDLGVGRRGAAAPRAGSAHA